ncbi:MAG: MFS transporter, partial [Rhodovibrionaceae bacterium]
MTAQSSQGRVAAPILLAYALPGLPLAALQLPLFVYIPAFYAQDLGLGLAAVGMVLLLARLWDMATDPLIGLLSDRTRWAVGRRKAWMLLGTPLLLVAAWFLLAPGPQAGLSHLLLWTFAITLGGTMVLVPYQAWGAELSADYHERSRIAGAREGLVVLGVLAATGLPPLLASDLAGSMRLLAWGLIFSLPLCVGICIVRVPDRKRGAEPALPLRAGLKIMLENAPFRRLLSAYLLNGIANGLPATLFVFFLVHVLRLDFETWAGPLLFVYFLSAICAVPCWLALARRIGKAQAWMLAMAMASLCFLPVPLLGEGDRWIFLGVCMLTGFALGAELALPPSIQADVVDLDRLRSGQERTGQFFALWGMATKLALALAAGIALPVLQLFGFDPSAAPGASGGLLVLALLYAGLPIVLKLTAM